MVFVTHRLRKNNQTKQPKQTSKQTYIQASKQTSKQMDPFWHPFCHDFFGHMCQLSFLPIRSSPPSCQKRHLPMPQICTPPVQGWLSDNKKACLAHLPTKREIKANTCCFLEGNPFWTNSKLWISSFSERHIPSLKIFLPSLLFTCVFHVQLFPFGKKYVLDLPPPPSN